MISSTGDHNKPHDTVIARPLRMPRGVLAPMAGLLTPMKYERRARWLLSNSGFGVRVIVRVVRLIIARFGWWNRVGVLSTGAMPKVRISRDELARMTHNELRARMGLIVEGR